jgi:hypothetical protein
MNISETQKACVHLLNYYSEAEELRKTHPNLGRYEIVGYTNSVKLPEESRGALTDRVKSLAQEMVSLRGRTVDEIQLAKKHIVTLPSENKAKLYEFAHTLWNSQFFKVLTPEERAAINEIRWACSTWRQWIGDRFLNFAVACQDWMKGTQGLTTEEQVLLFKSLEEIERQMFSGDARMSAKTSEFFGSMICQKLIPHELKNKRKYEAIRNLAKYVPDFVHEGEASYINRLTERREFFHKPSSR